MHFTTYRNLETLQMKKLTSGEIQVSNVTIAEAWLGEFWVTSLTTYFSQGFLLQAITTVLLAYLNRKGISKRTKVKLEICVSRNDT